MIITKQTATGLWQPKAATRLIQQGEAEAIGVTTNCALRAQHRTDHVYGYRPLVTEGHHALG